MSRAAPPATSADRPRGWISASGFALTLLFLVSAVNYADRTVMAVLQEPIKHDLGLTDWQLGLLGGPIFAIFYALVGLPVARLAERANRKRIVVVMIAIWSAITACCGLATNFLQIALFRVGVGAAESGSPPASHSLVADYFPPKRRGRAMAVLQLGVPIGTMVGSMVAGTVAHLYGWRLAFLVVGSPGLLLALVLAFVLREPARVRGQTEAPEGQPGWRSVLGLLKSPTFCFLMAAGALGGNASHGLDTFLSSFFIRRHGFTLAQIGGLFAVGRGVAGMAGAVAGGVLSDGFARKTLRAYAIVPGVAAIVAAVAFVIAFHTVDIRLSIATLFVGFFCMNVLPSPTYAAVQNLVGDRVRATAAALYLFFVTMVGSLAPPAVGFISDRVAAKSFPAALGAFAAACPGGKPAAGRASEIGSACLTASAQGVQAGLIVPSLCLVGALIVYLFAASGMAKMRV